MKLFGNLRASLLLVLFLVAVCWVHESESSHGLSPGPGSLTLGLVPERNVFSQLERYDAVAAYLKEKVGVPVVFHVVPNYGHVLRDLQEGSLDGAFLGSFTYVVAHRRLGVEMLAGPVLADGTSSYHGLLIARRASGIRDVKGLRNKTFAFVDRAATAGYLFPLAYLKRRGVSSYRKYFKEAYFAGTHEDALADVLAGRADACALKSTVFTALTRSDPGILGRIRILARSQDVPENGLGVRPDLDPVLKRRLKSVLLHMHEDAEGRRALAAIGARRMVQRADKEYDAVLHYAREIGLRLENFAYDRD
ncbi:MAG: phosphate/phosphite/phosphonate ABC transporter substrate-binding protein [Deltaproteobacteria bacterium]|nr:phosphate/phosphite/phosphonate ABC transporter substrate-binding protein [Deltaproteobacteria bacterium]